jgi:hypothetical protein
MNRTIWFLAIALALQTSTSSAQSVVRDGKEWLQPVDFDGLSWDEVNAVCPAPAGACAGTLNGINVTGYTWASVDDMNVLFNSYGISPPLGPGPDIYFEWPSTWAPQYFMDFEDMTTTPPTASTFGWTRSTVPDDVSRAYAASLQYSTVPEDTDAANTGSVGLKSVGIGAYIWRQATSPSPSAAAIPTMSVYGLALTVLSLLLVAARHLLKIKVSKR